MNKNENSIHQPYEIIETLEETITRYFNPNFCTTERTHISQRGNSHECPEQNKYEPDYSKITGRDSQFQDLLERFNKLRSMMSEITQRFEEINLIKAQVKNRAATFNSVNTGNEFNSNSGNEVKIQENNIDFESEPLPVKLVSDEVQNGLQNCTSYDRVESQPALIESISPPIKQVSGEGNCLVTNGDTQSPFTSNFSPKRNEAALLRKSKKLLIHLIDKELEKAQSGYQVGEEAILDRKSNVSVNSPISLSNSVLRRMGCIDKIKGELNILKDLEGIDG